MTGEVRTSPPLQQDEPHYRQRSRDAANADVAQRPINGPPDKGIMMAAGPNILEILVKLTIACPPVGIVLSYFGLALI
ncbi:hypothetical protein HOY34_10935 [Xinfangfangia sp. D13-10-4-6]|uniref:hypothetical protein n=1 Tax=Pseudogemmobacter hezensis TaxID=2737662 RepID=UPI001557C408|nr:hypothetical protein [Pseudogemmobacter hezensis]NPD15717.1 hypothetical protein [Pseudogemmobacter hezensis]